MKRVLISILFVNASVVALPAAQTSAPVPKKDQILRAEIPAYPFEAWNHRWQGTGIFVLHLRGDGTVESAQVAKSSGFSVLDTAAISAFIRWRFRPETPKTLTVPVTWSRNGVILPKSVPITRSNS